MQKILVLTSTFPRWENDTEPPFVFELCKQLAKEFEVYVLTPHCQGALQYETLQDIHTIRFRYFLESGEQLCYQGGMLAQLKKNRLRYFLIPFFLLCQLYSAHKIIKRENIKFIHAHWIIPQGITTYLLKALSNQHLKILCTSHGGDLFSLKGKLARLIKRKILQSIDGITVVNSVMAQEVYSLCHPQKPLVNIIPMGVDLTKFTPDFSKQQPFSLLFVGRLVEKKGLVYLIEAMTKILSKYPKTHLTIIGTGPQQSYLEKLSKQHNLNNNISFLGAIANTELPQYYRQNQIAIFPFIVADNGDREGLPVVVSEAIACGCCVITTDLPGLDDIVTTQHGSFVIPQKNSTAITNTVLELFEDTDKIAHHALSALKNIIEKQSWDIIGKKYCSLISHLIE